jgi:hypothetical protein
MPVRLCRIRAVLSKQFDHLPLAARIEDRGEQRGVAVSIRLVDMGTSIEQ